MAFYNSKKGKAEYEPKFILPAFQRFLRTFTKDGLVLNEQPFGVRYLEDCYKIGTTSWIFMGRQNCEPELFMDEWVIISRTVRPMKLHGFLNIPKEHHQELIDYYDNTMVGTTLWTAYSKESHDWDSFFEPSNDKERLKRIIHQYFTGEGDEKLFTIRSW
jgi:hypothetical protein